MAEDAARGELTRRRDRLEREIAEMIARIERIDAGIEDLEKDRGRVDEVTERQRLHDEITGRRVIRKRVKAEIEARTSRLEKVSRKLRRMARRARNRLRPKVITLDLDFREMTPQGTIIGSTGHYTAGPLDDDDEEAERLWRAYHQAHLNLEWAGLGYQAGYSRAGSIFLLRPFTAVGSHTYQNNTGRIGESVHGTTGDTWTKVQLRARRWWLRNGHKSVFPASHRMPSAPGGLQLRVHRQFNSTSCPGEFERGYLE